MSSQRMHPQISYSEKQVSTNKQTRQNSIDPNGTGFKDSKQIFNTPPIEIWDSIRSL